MSLQSSWIGTPVGGATATGNHFRLPPAPQSQVQILNQAQIQPQTTAPHVGSVIPDGGQGEPWTGGSNLAPKSVPTHLTQCRPYKYTASQLLLTKIEAGTTKKLGVSDGSTTCSFKH